MDISIIIVNYKSRRKLENCLQSIASSDFGGLSYETIVVENNSGENLAELHSNIGGFKLIESKSNLGMGGGNNLGMESASGEYIFILNPDTVLRPDAARKLFFYLKNNPGVGMVGPKLLYPDGSLQMSCSRFPNFFIPILRRTFLGDFFKKTRDEFTMSSFDHDLISEVDWLMGSCLMFKKIQRDANGNEFRPRFDHRYFMYFEDTDLGRTFRAKGLKVVYYPEAVVVHDHARESARHPWYIALFKDKITWVHIASWLKYFIKWGFKYPTK